MLFTCRKENLHAHVNLLFFPVTVFVCVRRGFFVTKFLAFKDFS